MYRDLVIIIPNDSQDGETKIVTGKYDSSFFFQKKKREKIKKNLNNFLISQFFACINNC